MAFIKKFTDWLTTKRKTVKPEASGFQLRWRPPPPPRPQGQNGFRAKEMIARKENPAVKDAWEKYQIVLKLAIGVDDTPPPRPPRVRSGHGARSV